jgi:hypothetical protein
MTAADKLKAAPGDHRLRETLAGFGDLPFLAIESDGSRFFPQIINTKLEAFCLHARRLHERIRAVRETSGAIDLDTRKNTREQ